MHVDDSTAGAFDGRVAVVTGGSRGIGAAACRALADAGAVVYALYRSNDEAAEDLVRSIGSRCIAVRADVTDPDAVSSAFARVAAEQGRLDVLINSAGGPSDGLLLRTKPEQVDAALALNLSSAISVCRAALPAMLKQRYGRIVNVSSVVASTGNPGQALYCAAKAGLEGFSRALAREVGRRGVTVNCVSPGFIDTDMTAEMPEARKEAIVDATALGRAGTPEDVASAVLFLASEGAAYVTGAVLQVNGGMYM